MVCLLNFFFVCVFLSSISFYLFSQLMITFTYGNFLRTHERAHPTDRDGEREKKIYEEERRHTKKRNKRDAREKKRRKNRVNNDNNKIVSSAQQQRQKKYTEIPTENLLVLIVTTVEGKKKVNGKFSLIVYTSSFIFCFVCVNGILCTCEPIKCSSAHKSHVHHSILMCRNVQRQTSIIVKRFDVVIRSPHETRTRETKNQLVEK